MKTAKFRKLLPPSRIGIIGGGQLGRMLTIEAKRMGYYVSILDPKHNSPAGQIADEQIVASFSDENAVLKLVQNSDVITFEFEHINAEILSALEDKGYYIFPSAKTLMKIQNKYKQKLMLHSSGLPVPKFSKVRSKEELVDLFYKYRCRIVLKTSSGGYDGKGNFVIKDLKELEKAYYQLRDFDLMAEEFVSFKKELSIVIAKNHDGTIVYYPVSENVHQDGILIKSIIPAKISTDTEYRIKSIAKNVVDILDDVGVYCIEFFLDNELNLYINEIAPRPHNSGHYTIEGCITSQYEQLIRIITGMPLGSSKLISSCAMVNILGDEFINGRYLVDGVDVVLKEKNCYLHLYGKHHTSYLRKLGHITVIDDSSDIAEMKAINALKSLKIKSL